MFRKSKRLFSWVLIGSLPCSFIFPVELNLSVLSDAEKGIFLSTKCTMGDTVTAEDILDKFEDNEKLKNALDRSEKHLNIYLRLPQAANSKLAKLQPLEEVKEIKNGQEYVCMAALKIEYSKDGKKQVAFLDIAGKDKAQRKKLAKLAFCNEHGLNLEKMEDDGEGGFVYRDGGDDTTIDDPNKKWKALQIFLVICLVLSVGGLLFWLAKRDEKGES